MELKSQTTQIVMMREELSRLFGILLPEGEDESYPLTFYNPSECVDMMLAVEEEGESEAEAPEEDEALSLERKWGELELRLSFFAGAGRWQ